MKFLPEGCMCLSPRTNPLHCGADLDVVIPDIGLGRGMCTPSTSSFRFINLTIYCDMFHKIMRASVSICITFTINIIDMTRFCQ